MRPADILHSVKGLCPRKVFIHIFSGIDLVQGKNKEWYILEDNLRVPSGASYPMIARKLSRKMQSENVLGIQDRRQQGLCRTFKKDHG